MYFSTMFLKMDSIVVKITIVCENLSFYYKNIDFYNNLCYNVDIG